MEGEVWGGGGIKVTFFQSFPKTNGRREKRRIGEHGRGKEKAKAHDMDFSTNVLF